MKVDQLLKHLDTIQASEEYKSYPETVRTGISSIITKLTQPITEPELIIPEIEKILANLQQDIQELRGASLLYTLLQTLQGNERTELQNDIKRISKENHPQEQKVTADTKAYDSKIAQEEKDFPVEFWEQAIDIAKISDNSQELPTTLIEAKTALDAWLASKKLIISNEKIFSKENGAEAQLENAAKIVKFNNDLIANFNKEQKLRYIIDIVDSFISDINIYTDTVPIDLSQKYQKLFTLKRMLEQQNLSVTDRLEHFNTWMLANNKDFPKLNEQTKPYFPLMNLIKQLQQIQKSPEFDSFLDTTKQYIEDIIKLGKSSENMNEAIFKKLAKCSDTAPGSQTLRNLVYSYSYVVSPADPLVMPEDFVTWTAGQSDQQRKEEEEKEKEKEKENEKLVILESIKKMVQLNFSELSAKKKEGNDDRVLTLKLALLKGIINILEDKKLPVAKKLEIFFGWLDVNKKEYFPSLDANVSRLIPPKKLAQLTAQAQTNMPEVEHKEGISSDIKATPESPAVQKDFSLDHWERALSEAKPKGNRAIYKVAKDAKLALDTWLTSNNYIIQDGKILLINSNTEAMIDNTQDIVKFNNLIVKYNTFLSQSNLSFSATYWMEKIQSINQSIMKDNTIIEKDKPKLIRKLTRNVLLMAKSALDQWLKSERLEISNNKIYIQESKAEANITNAPEIIAFYNHLSSQGITSLELQPQATSSEPPQRERVPATTAPNDAANALADEKDENDLDAIFHKVPVKEHEKRAISEEPEPKKRITQEPIINETQITLTKDQIDSFIQKRRRGFDGILNNSLMPINSKIEKLQAIVKDFEKFFKEGGVTLKENLFESSVQHSDATKIKYNLKEVEKHYKYFKRELQAIQRKLAKLEAIQIERLQEAKAQDNAKQIKENKIFLAMTPTKQLEHLKDIAKTVPLEDYKSKRDSLLALLNPTQLRSLFDAIPKEMKMHELRDPKNNELQDAINNVLNSYVIKDKWDIWSAQKEISTDQAKVEKVNVDKFLLLCIKNEIIDTDWKFPSKIFKYKKNTIEHQIGEEKKILYAPEHIVRIFNLITDAERCATTPGKSSAEIDNIWANTIKQVAAIGNKAMPSPKPSSTIGRLFSREKGDPRANELYRKLGTVHNKIAESTQVSQKTPQYYS